MNNKRLQLLPLWAAISAVIIIAGIVLMALLGFNTALDKPSAKTFDVYYNVVVDLSEGGEDKLKDLCEDAFAKAGISYEQAEVLEGQTAPVSLNQSGFSSTGTDFLLRYTFAGDVSDEKLASAKAAAEAAIDGDEMFLSPAETYVSFDTVTLQPMNEAMWRGAVGVAVAAVVALIYVAIRFGLGCALTGLVACVNDAFLTLAVLAVARIPVYAFAPMLYAAIAAVVSAVLWLIRCMKLRDAAKEPSAGALSAEESVAQVCRARRGAVHPSDGRHARVRGGAAARRGGALLLHAARARAARQGEGEVRRHEEEARPLRGQKESQGRRRGVKNHHKERESGGVSPPFFCIRKPADRPRVQERLCR